MVGPLVAHPQTGGDAGGGHGGLGAGQVLGAHVGPVGRGLRVLLPPAQAAAQGGHRAAQGAAGHRAGQGGVVVGRLAGLGLGQDRVLGQDRHAQGVDDVGHAVVDLRVDVVGAPGQHNAPAPVLAHPLQGAPALGAHVGLEGGVLGEARGHGPARLGQGHVPVGQDLDEPFGQLGGVGEVEEGGQQAHAAALLPVPAVPAVADGLDIGADDLGVGGHNGAVEVVVRPGHEVALVEDAGEPDRLDSLVDEELDVPVGELGGVADVLAGDGVHARLEQLVVGAPRDDDPEAQLGEDREPQRVVLVHAQHPGDADLAARVLPLAQAPVGEGAPVLVVVEVGHVRLLGAPLLGGAALAPVARDVALAVVEGRDGELAVVLAQLAHGGLGGQAEAGELGQGHEGAGDAVVVLVGGQRRPEAAHEAGDVGAHDLTPGQ